VEAMGYLLDFVIDDDREEKQLTSLCKLHSRNTRGDKDQCPNAGPGNDDAAGNVLASVKEGEVVTTKHCHGGRHIRDVGILTEKHRHDMRELEI
jgi:hypothetical protein